MRTGQKRKHSFWSMHAWDQRAIYDLTGLFNELRPLNLSFGFIQVLASQLVRSRIGIQGLFNKFVKSCRTGLYAGGVRQNPLFVVLN